MARPIQLLLPFRFLISLVWGFWVVANQLSEKKEIQLLLWLEVESTLPNSQFDNIQQTISNTFQTKLPSYSFQISNHKNTPTTMQVDFLNN